MSAQALFKEILGKQRDKYTTRLVSTPVISSRRLTKYGDCIGRSFFIPDYQFRPACDLSMILIDDIIRIDARINGAMANKDSKHTIDISLADPDLIKKSKQFVGRHTCEIIKKMENMEIRWKNTEDLIREAQADG